MDFLLQFDSVSKTFFTSTNSTFVLNNLNFKIKNNEIVALVGPSGCGKSTILNLISSLEKPTEGKIILNGKIGYMFQKDALLPWRNVFNNICFGFEINKSKSIENIKYAEELLKKYKLYDFKDNYPNELSGGMRQRVALIRTLANNPNLLLMDEPFSALDYQSRLAISDDIYNILKKEKKTMIMVTHDIAEACSICNKVIVLSNRPATIKNIYNIELENRSTPINNRKDKNFSYYYDMIWKDIDFHV
jgi:NitT/TauT family transport system ATP-binding protein